MKRATVVSLLSLLVLIPATLFLGTHLRGKWHYLTSTLVILEAMKHGLPVISTNIAAISDIVVRNQYGEGAVHYEYGYEVQLSLIAGAIRQKSSIVYDNSMEERISSRRARRSSSLLEARQRLPTGYTFFA